MNVLIDTHILLWWYLDAPELPERFRQALQAAESEDERVGLCAISLWELAKLAERGRLRLTRSLDDLFEHIEADPLIQVLPITGPIALESTRLGPRFHRDPADQLIVAAARCHGVPLMTCDEAIQRTGAVGLA